MFELEEVDTNGLLREATSRFTLDRDSIHGPAHWRAVLANGMALADAHECDRSIVAVFSLLHDCRRENEWRDPRHGERAAGVARELNGRFYDFEEARLSKLVEAIHWHDAGRTSESLDISCCWAADRIELRRVGIEPARWGFCARTWPTVQELLVRRNQAHIQGKQGS